MIDNTEELGPRPLDDAAGLCRRCHQSAWAIRAAQQPILSVACGLCGQVEWVGFLPHEWAQYVLPVTGK